MMCQYQHGAVLPLSMMILLILTIVGITSMQAATMDERMSGNMQDQNVAFQASEAGLREVEADLLKNTPEVMGSIIRTRRDFQNTVGLYHEVTNPDTPTHDAFETDSDANAIEATSVLGNDQNGNPLTGAKFIVTYVRGINGNNGGELGNAGEPVVGTRYMDIIKITAVSTGRGEKTKIVLETQVGLEPIPD